MRKLVVENKVTLDGVFDKQETWQIQFWKDPEELARYSIGQTAEFDALLLGRVTYEGLATVWPSMKDEVGYADWINRIPKYVVSTTLEEDDLQWNGRLVSENATDEVSRLKHQDGQDILMVGSADLMQTLMEHNLIDEYRIWVHPIVNGSGKRLFENESESTTLQLVQDETTDAGVVILHYQPVNTV